MVIRWTRAGAVAGPTTLQVRVSRRYPGRVAAGAPVPSRSLEPGEIEANLRHFTEGMRGPRTRPCDALVLSGVRLGAWPGLAGQVRLARELGVERVVLHLGGRDRSTFAGSDLAALTDEVALTVRRPGDVEDARSLRAGPAAVVAVVLLDAATLPRLDRLCQELAQAAPDKVVLTWPFPPAEPPPPAREVVRAMADPVAHLERAGVRYGVKGLPLCRLGPLADRMGRSRNRWYVDAEHQLDGALLFFPDVVRFARTDACRFCTAVRRCDGAPAAWLASGRAGTLEPVEPGG